VKPRLFIFDFDGTLADSFSWFLDASDSVADRFGFDRLDRSDLDGLRALDARHILVRQRVPLWKLPLIARHARHLMARDIDRIPLFAGIGEALARLVARGVTLAIVSSNSQANVLRVLGPGAAPLFQVLECGVALFGKASRLRRVLKRTGIPAAETLFVGDEIRDAIAARTAGLAFGAVAWGYTRLEALRGQAPEVVFERPEDLPAFIGA
jgi:phosphoglycolate phosphatase